jgi:lipid-binding SYLF domain-containing protein
MSPSIRTLKCGSIGLQIGGQASEAVFIIMTEKGLKSVIDHQVKLGADIGVAAGPFGVGAEASTTANLKADILAYTMNKGLFAGVSLEGAVVAKREDWNAQYYGKGATPRGIVVEGKFANPNADKLRATLARF